MTTPYPGYDVLAKRDTPSWNEATRRVIAARLAIGDTPRFFNAAEFLTVKAICDRITPQPADRAPIPVAGLLDDKLYQDERDGYRNARIPPLRQAWRRGLSALDEESRFAHGVEFHRLEAPPQDALLTAMQKAELRNPAWGDMPCELFFRERLLPDVILAYYAHPIAWSEIGWGGPASPRGYVRMGFNRRDPWEPIEAHGERVERLEAQNRRVR